MLTFQKWKNWTKHRRFGDSLWLDEVGMRDIAPILESIETVPLDIEVSSTLRATKILVVDDEWLIARTVAAILRREGYEAFPYTNPLEALQASEMLAPDVLISDVAMPGLSGIDLALQMKGLDPQCKILLFSGQAATSDLLEKARVKGHEFLLLAKPVHPSVLLFQITQLR